MQQRSTRRVLELRREGYRIHQAIPCTERVGKPGSGSAAGGYVNHYFVCYACRKLPWIRYRLVREDGAIPIESSSTLEN